MVQNGSSHLPRGPDRKRCSLARLCGRLRVGLETEEIVEELLAASFWIRMGPLKNPLCEFEVPEEETSPALAEALLLAVVFL